MTTGLRTRPAPPAPVSPAPRPAPRPKPSALRRPRLASTTEPILFPELHPTTRATRSVKDSFGKELATLALSPSLSAGFSLTAPGSTTHLSHRELDSRGWTIRDAWDTATHNLQMQALTPQGLRLWTRPATRTLGNDCPPGWEVRIQGGLATAWLAHPRTFSALNKHLLNLTRAAELTYLAPDRFTLYVLADCSPAETNEWANVAYCSRPPHRTPLLNEPLKFVRGFPLTADQAT
ncbi:hypothetical protein VVR26_01965 [Corynebacterium camporealensis]|uniref:hypothetical protein n=1 Tax=Corynebacterium camporealensis TaxID=161896 RepID=UPI0034CFC43E